MQIDYQSILGKINSIVERYTDISHSTSLISSRVHDLGQKTTSP